MKFTTNDVANPAITNSSWPTRLQQSIPSSYTVWYDPVYALYRAESNIAGGTDYSGAVAYTAINNALDALTGGRTWQEKVIVKGDIILTGTLQIPSYTILEIHGRLYLANATNDEMIINKNQDVTGNTYITILGGELNGNAAGQTFGAGYNGTGIQFANVDNSSIIDTYIHNTWNGGIHWLIGAIGGGARNSNNLISHVRVNTTTATGAGTAIGCCTLGKWDDGIIEKSIFQNAADFGGLTMDECLRDLVFKCEAKNNVRAGFIFEGTAADAKTAAHEVIACSTHNNTGTAGYGFNVIEDLDEIKFLGCRSYLNDSHGFRIEGMDNGVFDNNVSKNNKQGGATGDGILLMDAGTACLHNILVNNHCFDDQVAHTQAYGIRELNNADYNTIVANVCYNNVTANILKIGVNSIKEHNIES